MNKIWTCILHHWRVISVMSMEKLWNQPLYKTVIDMWNMWTNLTTWQTFTVLADGFGNGQKAILPFSGPYHFQQLYHSHLLWLKIITLSLQTDISERSNRRGRKGASTSDCKTKRQALTTSQLKRLDLRHNRHWLMQCKRTRCHACSTKHKTRTKYKYSECNIGLCSLYYYILLSTQL